MRPAATNVPTATVTPSGEGARSLLRVALDGLGEGGVPEELFLHVVAVIEAVDRDAVRLLEVEARSDRRALERHLPPAVLGEIAEELRDRMRYLRRGDR